MGASSGINFLIKAFKKLVLIDIKFAPNLRSTFHENCCPNIAEYFSKISGKFSKFFDLTIHEVQFIVISSSLQEVSLCHLVVLVQCSYRKLVPIAVISSNVPRFLAIILHFKFCTGRVPQVVCASWVPGSNQG